MLSMTVHLPSNTSRYRLAALLGALVLIHDKSNDNVVMPIATFLTCLHLGREWFRWAARGGRNDGMFFCCCLCCFPSFLFAKIKTAQVYFEEPFFCCCCLFRLDRSISFSCVECT